MTTESNVFQNYTGVDNVGGRRERSVVITNEMCLREKNKFPLCKRLRKSRTDKHSSLPTRSHLVPTNICAD